MAMRTTVASMLGITLLFIGVFALSEAASQSETQAQGTSGGTEAWELSTSVIEGLALAGSPGVVWMGVAAIILVALGVLVASFSGGR